MKIELLTDSYANAQGFKLEGPGIHDVDPTRAKYLLATFPDWFQAVDQDAVDVVADTEEGQGTDVEENDEPQAAQEPSEPEAPTKSLSKMNKTELQALAAEIGVEVSPDEMTADQMREAIKSAQEAA